MDGFGSSNGYGGGGGGGGDRRLEIVSGKGFNSNHVYATRIDSPDLPPVPYAMARASQDGSSKPWGFNDPEVKRKKRIAQYKVYTVEGKVKASFRNGFRWIKAKCSQIVRGY
ncbi:uncharacterized protein LOC126708182 [Quercus robur]|uniref:DUF3511 domain protein n=1 Tax=Quercus lobata TaxID=97700 RepID=A0A7N2N4X6_QUELO|nr:uncharacterized protein LOC115970496 [Quercus lobata]XP_050263945.1 uncharacterized protein LOC126708182 [Quercus robur]